MANLWVIVTGLAVLVRRQSDSDIVLLRQVQPRTVVPPQNGKEISPHSPALTLLPGSAKVDIGYHDLDFLPGGEGSPEINENEPFIRVGVELEDALKVQDKFIGPRAGVPDGWSRVVLSGGGNAQIWPIHVVKELEVKTISTKVKLKLVGARDLIAATTKRKNKPRVGNGVLYYRRVAETPKAYLNSREYPMSPIDHSDARALPIQNDQPHYVAWVANSGMESGEEFDRDFFLLYEVLGEPVTRFVPLIKTINDQVELNNPPGQCMISYALG